MKKRNVAKEELSISVSGLKNIKLLFQGDLYELALFLLRMHDAKDKGTNITTRETVFGLSGIYASLVDVDRNEIIKIVEQHGIPIGATIQNDHDLG